MTTTEKNKLIAEFMGYYQPKEVKDDLHSFEVYASKRNAKKDYPKDNIITYYGNDIEDFTFVDKPKYHSSWDWLMPVVEKIESLSEVNYKIEISHYTYIDTLPRIIYRKGTRIENTYNAVVDFILWYNKQNPA